MSTTFAHTVDRVGHLVELARDTTADVDVVLCQSAGLQDDTQLAAHPTLAALLATSTDECDFTGYTRRTLAAPTRTVDIAALRVLLGGAAPGTALQLLYERAGENTTNRIGKALFCWRPGPGAADDTVLPLVALDVDAVADGNDLLLTVAADGFLRVPVRS